MFTMTQLSGSEAISFFLFTVLNMKRRSSERSMVTVFHSETCTAVNNVQLLLSSPFRYHTFNGGNGGGGLHSFDRLENYELMQVEIKIKRQHMVAIQANVVCMNK